MNKPTLKGEIAEKIKLPFGNISIKMNQYGSYEIQVDIEETHVTSYYQMRQRKNNTLEQLILIIKEANET